MDPGGGYRPKRGDVMVNDVTRQRAVVLVGPGDEQGDRLCVHLTLQPRGAVAPEHRHPQIEERLRVLAGRLALRIGGQETELGPGDEAVVPAGAWHESWNAGDTPAQVIQDIEPGQRFSHMAATAWGLANAGETDDKGMPSLLQLALMAREFSDVLVVRMPPVALQRALFAVLAPIARVRGLRGRYPERFEAAHEREEPDPALLDYVSTRA